MKKNILAIGLALAMTGCGSDTYEDWLSPQSSQQEAAKTITLTVTPAQPIKFAEITTDSVQLFVPKITASDANVSNYTVVLHAVEGNATKTLQATENGMVSKTELEKAYYTLAGYRPIERTINLDITALTTVNGINIKNVGNTTATLTANAPVLSATGYYIVGNCQNPTWQNDDTSLKYEFNGTDPYSNSTIVFRVPAPIDGSGLAFKIFDLAATGNKNAPTVLSCKEEKAIAANGTEKGQLVDNTNGQGKNITAQAESSAKFYEITVDLLAQTYTVKALNFSAFIYERGTNTSWGDKPACPLYSTASDGKYQGFMYLNGEFKFMPNANNWDGDWENDGDGKIADNGGANNPAPETGFYAVNVDLTTMTYSLKKIDFIDIVGNVKGGASDWSSGPHMTYNVAEQCWEADVNLTGSQIKFRGNGNWSDDDGNWGGEVNNILNGSSENVHPGITGDVHVKLYVSCNTKSRVVITKK